ncbi:MAG: hypothetical protein JNN15_10610, partial [Blastocatellia bacterium]|nr:hypothetical protein [Blastocatellia bacterium]
GRDWIISEIDEFLNNKDRGYFILEAEAGLGKTTFLAYLAKKRNYIHHFAELAEGQEGIGASIKNVAAQIVLTGGLEADEAEGVLPGNAVRAEYLTNLLKRASEKREGKKIVLVIDALDQSGSLSNQNVMGLPKVLPEGVYIIASQRPVQVALTVDVASTPKKVFPVKAELKANLDDMRRFLEKAAKWPEVIKALEHKQYTTRDFVETLLDKCRGVWIYLHYVVAEIKSGQRSPLALEALPNGMTQYYIQYWSRWRDRDNNTWYQVYLPILTCLAAAQEAVTPETISGWSGVKWTPVLTRLLKEEWRPFLIITGEVENKIYRFYHATLREFFSGKVDRKDLIEQENSLIDEISGATKGRHSEIVDRYFREWGGIEAKLPNLKDENKRDIDKGYGINYITTHLEASSRIDDLHHLLSLEDEEQKNLWFRIKDSLGETESYVSDVYLGEKAANLSNKFTEIGLRLRYALIFASLNSIASNLPPELITELVKAKLWSSSKALQYINQMTDEGNQVEALQLIIEYLPKSKLEIALSITEKVIDEYRKAYLLTELAKHIPERVLESIEKIEAEYSRAKLLIELTKYMPDKREILLNKALESAEKVEDEYSKASLLTELVKHIPKKREIMLNKALELAETVKNEYSKAYLLTELVKDIPEKRDILLNKVLELTKKLRDEYSEALILGELAKYMPEKVLESIEKIEDKYSRAYLLTELAKNIPEKKEVLLNKALESVKGIEKRSSRVGVLQSLSNSLSSNVENIPLEVWKDMVKLFSSLTRPDLLPVIAEALPVVERVGGKKAVVETCDAVEDVCRWWP